jgi:glycerophosphoryl diester phosphodiesterase
LSSSIPASDWWQSAPLVIAHRGASHGAPENTLAAFRLAADSGADAIELDARLSCDGAVVVVHDSTLERTTNGTGPVSERNLTELKSLDAGAEFGAAFAGEPIPLLDEVFEAVGQRVLINVELKDYEDMWDLRLAKAVVGLVRHHGLERRVLVSSFAPFGLRTVRRLAPEVPLALLLWPDEKKWMEFAVRRLAPFEACHSHQRMTDSRTIAAEHARGRRVNVWTVNDEDRMRELLLLGADGLITDAIDVARRAVQDVSAAR